MSETTSTESPAETSIITTAAQEPGKNYDLVINDIARKGIYEFVYAEGPKDGEKIIIKRKKISVKKMNELEQMRAEYGGLIADMNAVDGGRSNRKLFNEDRKKAATMLTDIYAKCAEYYFGVERNDFEMFDWDSMKINIDAATNVSLFGRPNLA